MFKAILKRSLASAVAVGTVIAMASLTSPATVSSAPAIEHMAGCKPKYPAKIATSTSVSVEKSMQRYGESNSATATVSSGVGTPEGWVRFSTSGWSDWERLSGGSASTSLPKLRAGKTYRISAKFYPSCRGNDYRYQKSSGSAYVSVYGIPTSVSKIYAPDREVGESPKVWAGVTAEKWHPYGTVRVTISNGTESQTKYTRLKGHRGNTSFAKVYFGPVYEPGTWTVDVDFLGNRHYEPSSGSSSFEVFGDSGS